MYLALTDVLLFIAPSFHPFYRCGFFSGSAEAEDISCRTGEMFDSTVKSKTSVKHENTVDINHVEMKALRGEFRIDFLPVSVFCFSVLHILNRFTGKLKRVLLLKSKVYQATMINRS